MSDLARTSLPACSGTTFLWRGPPIIRGRVLPACDCLTTSRSFATFCHYSVDCLQSQESCWIFQGGMRYSLSGYGRWLVLFLNAFPEPSSHLDATGVIFTNYAEHVKPSEALRQQQATLIAKLACHYAKALIDSSGGCGTGFVPMPPMQ